jgi:hypothetical protein
MPICPKFCLFLALGVEQHPHAKHGHEQNIKANSPRELLGSNWRSKYQTLPFFFFFSFSNCGKNMIGQAKTMNMGKRQNLSVYVGHPHS